MARICRRVRAEEHQLLRDLSILPATSRTVFKGGKKLPLCEKPLGRRSYHESKRQPTSLLMGQWFDRKGGRVTMESSSSNHWFKSMSVPSFLFFFFQLPDHPPPDHPLPDAGGFVATSPRTPNVHISGPRFQHHQKCGGRQRKSATWALAFNSTGPKRGIG